MNKIKIHEKSGVAYLQDSKIVHSIVCHLRERDGTTAGWLTTNVWPRANNFDLGYAIQIKCSGSYLNRSDIEAILHEIS